MKRWILLTGLLAAAVLAVVLRVPHAKSALAYVPDHMVTLTFDDGPDPRFTPEILEMLKQRHLTATFFVVGQNALAHPDLTREIVKQGHLIANHSFTHPELEKLDRDQVYKELSDTDTVLVQILGSPHAVSPYFRPPRGNISDAITDTVNKMNKQMVLWNVCVENRSTQTPEAVRARVMRLIRERHGGILLAHDGELDRSLTVQSLPLILDDLQREGYKIVPLDEYLSAELELTSAHHDRRTARRSTR
ncbi:polysaccharide deacetylase family protein [Effusibacillus pohliae]|uniref:polysaccharide deacetylase family protein n=1 Tax=Effusibacillus pohliae TaxID=232270 RepID=UPI000360839B|nr:polysaccharide deacetylase family protein [Effusibacillus pohliae]